MQNLQSKQLSFLEEPQKIIYKDEKLEEIQKMKEENDFLNQIKEEYSYYLELKMTNEELKNFINHACNQFKQFIERYFKNRDPFYYMQLANKYSDFKRIYHQMGKLLLFYFNNFYVFENTKIDQNTLQRIETFILKDKIRYQEKEVTEVFKKLKINENPKIIINQIDKVGLEKKNREKIKENDFLFRLTTFFVLNYDKNKNPIMCYTGSREEKRIAIEIALEYLSRLYTVSHYHKIEDDYIIALENFIIDRKQEDIIMTNSKLCVTKSIVMARVNARNVLGHDTNALKLVLK